MNFFDVYRESKEEESKWADLLNIIITEGIDDDKDNHIGLTNSNGEILNAIKKMYPGCSYTEDDIQKKREELQRHVNDEAEKKKKSGKVDDDNYTFHSKDEERARAKKNLDMYYGEIDKFVTEFGYIPATYEELIHSSLYDEEEYQKFKKNTEQEKGVTKALETYRLEHTEIAAYSDLRLEVLQFEKEHPDVSKDKIADIFMKQEKYEKLEGPEKSYKKDQIDTILGISKHTSIDNSASSFSGDSVEDDYEKMWENVQGKVKDIEKRFKKLSRSKSLRKVAGKNPALMGSLKAMGGLLSGLAAGVGIASAVLNYVVPGIDLFTEPATTLMKPVAVAGKYLQNAGSPMKSYRGNYKAKRDKDREDYNRRHNRGKPKDDVDSFNKHIS